MEKQIWVDIKADTMAANGFIYIDAWITKEIPNSGKSIAKINAETKEVIYLDKRAKTNSLAQEVIKETLANL